MSEKCPVVGSFFGPGAPQVFREDGHHIILQTRNRLRWSPQHLTGTCLFHCRRGSLFTFCHLPSFPFSCRLLVLFWNQRKPQDRSVSTDVEHCQASLWPAVQVETGGCVRPLVPVLRFQRHPSAGLASFSTGDKRNFSSPTSTAGPDYASTFQGAASTFSTPPPAFEDQGGRGTAGHQRRS